MDPTPEEVAAQVAEVWDQVSELAATDEGRAMMAAALDAYPTHDE